MHTVVAWILVLAVLVAIHELGHFFVAKGFHMGVDEYSIGFGPAIFKRTWHSTQYALRIIPLGGYVRLTGMNGEDKVGPRDYPNRALWQRFLVIFAGPVMNLLLAALIYAIAMGPVGQPVATTTVAQTLRGYPAAAAGLHRGDQIIAVDGQPIGSWVALENSIERHRHQTMTITVRYRQQIRVVTLHTRYDRKLKADLVGISPIIGIQHLPPLQAVSAGIQSTVQLTGSWFVALFHLVEGKRGVPVQGPVGIAVDIGDALQAGIFYLLMLSAALSANLGLFNILPFPVLDGSRLFLIGLEGVRRKPMDPDREGMIHLVGMAILLLFVVVVTFHDIAALIGIRLSL